MQLKGEPIQVVSTTDNHTYELNEDALEKILSKVKDMKVVVVSVAGVFGTGKSFMLNFFLRYLNAKCSDEWLRDDTSPLIGFAWKGGCKRTTSGIFMWSEPFKVNLPNKEQVVVLLMDTQGSSDDESTERGCTTVFALSTMLSSVQVFNLRINICSRDLQELQSLQFLVRDWKHTEDYAYGAEGGNGLLKKWLQIKKNKRKEQQSLREHIQACYERIKCFLMPYPGRKVDVSEITKSDGRLADIEEDFRKMLHPFVSSLLATENLIVKKVDGTEITGNGFIEYFKAWIEIFQGNKLPEPKTILDATAEANNSTALNDAKNSYTKEMEKICGKDKFHLDPEELKRKHDYWKAHSVTKFCTTLKMGSEEFVEGYKKKLEDELKNMYEIYKENNVIKKEFAEANNSTAVNDAKNVYKKDMEMICGESYIDPEQLKIYHYHCKNHAIETFYNTPKKGVAEFSKKYQKKLEVELENMYENYVKLNDSRKSMFQKVPQFAKGAVAGVIGTIAVAAQTTAVVVGAAAAAAAAAAAVGLGLIACIICSQ